jgi:hypothetical protein
MQGKTTASFILEVNNHSSEKRKMMRRRKVELSDKHSCFFFFLSIFPTMEGSQADFAETETERLLLNGLRPF